MQFTVALFFLLLLIMAQQKTRKVRTSTKKPTKTKPQQPHKKADAPKTTAKPLRQPKEDLTLFDWIQVLDYVDAHPANIQKDIVDYFATRPSGVLKFTQSALSKKLKIKDQLRERANSNPNALSEKRARVVTHPDVEEALYLWHQSQFQRGNSVTGPMLIEKRKRLEHLFDVPQEERLTGGGWLASYKKAYVYIFFSVYPFSFIELATGSRSDVVTAKLALSIPNMLRQSSKPFYWPDNKLRAAFLQDPSY